MDPSGARGPAVTAVVLAGGAARRLGGADKPATPVGGVPLLDRVLAALPAEAQVVVVGPARPTSRPVRWTREDPPGGGPVAALVAGLAPATGDRVLLLAADLPFLTPAAVAALLDAVGEGEGAVLVDDDDRPQWLTSAWRTASLRSALPAGDPAGLPLRAVLGGLRTARVALPGEGPPPWLDCDTPDDLRRAEEHA
ncbi:MAG TPA: molybdenum cofactor guanylyltransferase [Mycobacteriales bacterium]|nr:molybdenum cofactor guanylyltransferase [Mycobacteriales bacterium]